MMTLQQIEQLKQMKEFFMLYQSMVFDFMIDIINIKEKENEDGLYD